MLKKRHNAAQIVADHLIAAELAIDEAIARTAALNAAMPEARREAALAAEVGHEALEHSSASFQRLVEARSMIVKAHSDLAATRDQIGLRTVSFGSLYGKPSAAALVEVVREAA